MQWTATGLATFESGALAELGRLDESLTVAESASQVAVFDVPHTITVSEITSDGPVAVASSEGSARVWLDGEFCRGSEQTAVAVRGKVEPNLLQTATIHHVDARDPITRLTGAVPALGRPDSAALHHLSAFLAPRNLIARPELLTTEYRTSLAVGSLPEDPLDAIRQRGLTPRCRCRRRRCLRASRRHPGTCSAGGSP